MKQENDQPNHDRKRTPGEGNKHQPAKDAERIEEMPVVFSVDHARMDRTLIHFATVRVGDPTARYDRSDGREGDKNDQRQHDPITDPGKRFPSW